MPLPGLDRVFDAESPGAEQIVGLLRQADVDLGMGMNVPTVCRRLGISQQTYYRWQPGRSPLGTSA